MQDSNSCLSSQYGFKNKCSRHLACVWCWLWTRKVDICNNCLQLFCFQSRESFVSGTRNMYINFKMCVIRFNKTDYFRLIYLAADVIVIHLNVVQFTVFWFDHCLSNKTNVIKSSQLKKKNYKYNERPVSSALTQQYLESHS